MGHCKLIAKAKTVHCVPTCNCARPGFEPDTPEVLDPGTYPYGYTTVSYMVCNCELHVWRRERRHRSKANSISDSNDLPVQVLLGSVMEGRKAGQLRYSSVTVNMLVKPLVLSNSWMDAK